MLLDCCAHALFCCCLYRGEIRIMPLFEVAQVMLYEGSDLYANGLRGQIIYSVILVKREFTWHWDNFYGPIT
jgi:hypothetical protein